MKLLIFEPCLFDVFEKDKEDPSIAVAQVFECKNYRIRLSGLGNSVIDLPFDSGNQPIRLKSRQTVRFLIDGNFVDPVNLSHIRSFG